MIHDVFTEIILVSSSEIAIRWKVVKISTFSQIFHRLGVSDSGKIGWIQEQFEVFGVNIVFFQILKFFAAFSMDFSGDGSEKVDVNVQQLVEFRQG